MLQDNCTRDETKRNVLLLLLVGLMAPDPHHGFDTANHTNPDAIGTSSHQSRHNTESAGFSTLSRTTHGHRLKLESYIGINGLKK